MLLKEELWSSTFYIYYLTLNYRCLCFCCLGGFYSDELAYVGKGCKKCPNGSFVPYAKAPGKRTSDCKSCPPGKDEASITYSRIVNICKKLLFFCRS